MKTNAIENTAFVQDVNEVAERRVEGEGALRELTDLQLILVGGGSADVILG